MEECGKGRSALRVYEERGENREDNRKMLKEK